MNAVIRNPASGARWRLAGAVLIIVAAFSLGGGEHRPRRNAARAHRLPVTSTSIRSRSRDAADRRSLLAHPVAPAPARPANAGATLPFTGVSLIWPAIAAIVLVSLGLGLRRHERKNS